LTTVAFVEVPLTAVLAGAFFVAVLPALAAGFFGVALDTAGFFTDADAVRAPAPDLVRVDSFEDTLGVTFLDAGCLTDFATFASLSEVWMSQPMSGVSAGGQRRSGTRMRQSSPVRTGSGPNPHWGTLNYIKCAAALP
jgi:hypothetical protein